MNLGQKQVRATNNKIQLAIQPEDDESEVQESENDQEMQEEVIMSGNKNSRDEIIEYNPEELSYDGSDDDNYYDNHQLLQNNNLYNDAHPQFIPEKNLSVVGKAMPVYGCKNWGKNPYYVVVARPRHSHHRHKIHNFDSIDNQYNWLGIDEKEAYKIVTARPLNENKVCVDMLNSIDDWMPHKNTSFIDIYDNDMGKHDSEHSAEIIAVNDTDNEMIVPEDMEIHDIEQAHRVPNMIMNDSLDYLQKKLSLSKSQLMSSS